MSSRVIEVAVSDEDPGSGAGRETAMPAAYSEVEMECVHRLARECAGQGEAPKEPSRCSQLVFAWPTQTILRVPATAGAWRVPPDDPCKDFPPDISRG